MVIKQCDFKCIKYCFTARKSLAFLCKKRPETNLLRIKNYENIVKCQKTMQTMDH